MAWTCLGPMSAILMHRLLPAPGEDGAIRDAGGPSRCEPRYLPDSATGGAGDFAPRLRPRYRTQPR